MQQNNADIPGFVQPSMLGNCHKKIKYKCRNIQIWLLEPNKEPSLFFSHPLAIHQIKPILSDEAMWMVTNGTVQILKLF